ncbi:(2,3-dihydroxybenzoyl)adenylate synthase [Vallitalea guaymasensis]|uniref:(2,3-dihydroxybenzoyl)adenylate synthase n=1 Tax=Vallitalea guaymasensis TaxID=1185412 RepID=UPI002729D3A5|nr:AMP-binding protein [Vallitalea guaymasensis]
MMNFNDIYDTYEKQGYYEALTMGEHLENWAEKYGDKIALVEEDKRITYRKLNQKVYELAAGFYKTGIGKGDNVVVQLPNSIAFVITCFALFRIGARPVFSLPAHRESELNGVFNIAKPIAYIIPTDFLGFDYSVMAEKMSKKYPCLKLIITDGQAGDYINLNDLFIEPFDIEDEPSYKETALFLLSGGTTTGKPKLIPKIHSAYMYNAKASAVRCGLDETSVYLAFLPIAHDFPFCSPGVLGTLLSGGKVVLCKTSSPDEVFPMIEREQVTVMALVPAIGEVWLDAVMWGESADFSSIKLVIVGATKIEYDTAERLSETMGCKIQQGYGLGEGLTCFTSLDDPVEIAYTCQGSPISQGDEVKIVDENGEEVEDGEYGELLEKGPYTFTGYYNSPELNEKAFTDDGFFRTGDRARFTKEGNIQLGGRIIEIINRAGEKIVPAELEDHLRKYKDIKDVAVVPMPDKNLGQAICAFITTDDYDINFADINEFLRNEGVAAYRMPDKIKVIDFLPRTNVGKVDKVTLKKMLE